MFDLSDFPLPFARDALAPAMSAETIDFHYGRHLAAYIKNTNDLIAGTKYADAPLYQIIRNAYENQEPKLFNNAAQIFNHDFFFHCLGTRGGGVVPAKIADAFGGGDEFRRQFKDAAIAVFGSGWTWLVIDGGKMKIVNTANADMPAVHGMRPILCLDVWEHAYYLDYQNRRAEYVDAFLDKLVNWEFVVGQLPTA